MAHMNEKKDRHRLPALKSISKKNLTQALNDVNRSIETIKTTTLEEINQVMYSVAVVVTEDLGLKVNRPAKHSHKDGTPKWKIRLENKINKLRSDVSKLKAMKENKLKNKKTREDLIRRYHLESSRITEVLEVLKQRITAVSKKISRYEDRVIQYRQNLLFQSNQKRFYQNLNGQINNKLILPDKQETINFWKNLWDNPKDYNRRAGWIAEAEATAANQQMEELVITTNLVTNRAKRINNWTAPGKDELHGFWLKHLTSLHPRIAEQMNIMLQGGEIEEWITTGRTYLIQKDPAKGAIPSNYRPITCLPTTFKLMTGILSDAIQDHLESKKLFPVEQKGNCRNSRGTKDQLLIDKMILENCKRRKTNLHIAWIDYKKAFDSLPHTWILKCLEMYGISRNISTFLNSAMKKWKTELTVGSEVLGRVNIRRGIFQGDSLSPLLFIIAMIPLSMIIRKTGLGYQASKIAPKISHLLYMDDLKLYGKSQSQIESLLHTVQIYSKDIAMEFGFDKCAKLSLCRGRLSNKEGIEFPNGNKIRSLEEQETYKYLGILQADNIKHAEVKNKISREYVQRVRKILKSKLNGGNTIKAINSWAIPVIRYTAGIVNWTQAELEALDRKTRKIMTINHALHPRSDVDRLYLPRKIGGRGMLQVYQTVEEEKRALADYIKGSTEEALMLTVTEGLLKMKESKEAYKKDQMNSRKERWHHKPLHGQYVNNIKDKVDNTRTWQWLKKGKLKKETEGLILAAQEQALRTNSIQAHIDHVSNNSKCRLCKEAEETVDHLVSCCKKIAQTDYKERHDKVATMIHWNICKKYNIPASNNWWDHKTEKVCENNEAKILWDFKIQTDKHLPHNTPDITVVEKKQVWIIDIAVPGDSRVAEKQIEKITKYKDLQIEIERLWQKKAVVVPVVIGALGAIPKDLQNHLDNLGISKITISQLQKAALLGTAHILRRYL